MEVSKPNNNTFPSLGDLDDFLTKHNSNFVWLLVATILSCGWIIYLTYYNSRNIGLILTIIINRLYKDGYIHIGSFSFSVLSGKVMFRDVYFINQDMSIRIQDGFLIFRWWKMFNPKQKQHDPKAETRLYVTVNGFEFHVYNRTGLYAQLQEIFGLEPTLINPSKYEEKSREDRGATLDSVTIKEEIPDPSSSWRSLIPVIKVNISTGRLAFGNHHLPQTLCVNFEDAFLTYATKPPSSHRDRFMHILKGSLENVRVMLVPSPRYVGMQNDEPPRLMGEGFVVMQSNDVDIYYYQDEPGLVPEEQDGGEVEVGGVEDKLQDLPPCRGLDIVCGKGTDFNYGPWADRQRDALWKFFLPADYQAMKVTEESQPGKLRQILAFELRMNIIDNATIDLLFTKNRETNAIHVNVGAGSYLEVNIPMTVGEEGYSPTIKGQLLHVDTTSSMQYRTLLEAEMLAFHVIASYPRVWNMPQSWQCEIEVYKATYHFIYAQKNFFTDLIQDWASDSAPDIYSFVPYAWKFKVLFHQFEMIWAANQHNWIDCSTKHQENVYLAACGETLNLDFTLPFNEFVPTTCNTRFNLRAEDTDMRLSLPECHPSRYPFLTLAKDYQNIKLPTDQFPPGDTQGAPLPKHTKSRWRNITHAESGWVDCWSVPNFLLIIDYTWHPIYPQKLDEQLKQSLSEIEESMLSSLRPPEHTPLPHRAPLRSDGFSSANHSRPAADPSELPPDRLHVEMEMSPDSQILLYGPLLRALVAIKENYFGEDDMYTDFEETVSSPVLSTCTSSGLGWSPLGMEDGERREASSVHPLHLRPWDITVLINLYKVHGRLPMPCSSEGPEGPSGFLERLCFEMKKGYKETMLQLILSPIHIFLSDNYQRPTSDGMLRDGHLSLTGLQMRAHAMFSAQGLPMGSDTLEYAWLIDMQAGLLTGRVTIPQLANVIEWGETFVFHVVSREFQLEQPKPSVICQHGVDRRLCDAKMSCLPGHCRTSEDLKYTMTRLAVDGADIFVVEHGCAANIKTATIRLASCNLHNQAVGEGISAVVQDVSIHQYIEQQTQPSTDWPRVPLGGQGPAQPPTLRRSFWLEAGSVDLNLITADIALAADHSAKCEVQRQFLELHDAQSKRLWFLWPDDPSIRNKRGRSRCGCLGGCRFFGGNNIGLDFFKLEEVTPSSSFSGSNAEWDMCYGQSLLHPGECIITKETAKAVDGRGQGVKKDAHLPGVPPELPERRGHQHLSLQVPQRSHSSASSSEENSSSSAAQPLLSGERDTPSPGTETRAFHMNSKSLADTLEEVPEGSPLSPSSGPDRSALCSPVCSPLHRQSSVHSSRLGSTKSLSAAVFTEKPPSALSGAVQFSSDVSRSDENVLDSPAQRRSYSSFPFTPSADSNTFHQYRSADSSMSVAESEAYFSATEDFEPISSADEGPGTYPGRKKKRRQQMGQQPPPYHMDNYSRSSIYHSVEGPLTYVLNGELITEPRPHPHMLTPSQPLPSHTSQASFVSALAMEEESSMEAEKTAEPGPVTRQPHVMACYQNYLSQYQVSNWSVKQPTNKRTSKSSLHRPLDLDTPTGEESPISFDQLSVPSFKVVKHGLSASSLLDRGIQLMEDINSTPYTPLDKKAMDNTDEETTTDDWSLDQPLSQTRTTAIVEVKGAINVVLTPLVAETLDRYIDSMVHFVSIRHPTAILDDLHGKVLNEAYQISKSTVTESSQTAKQEHKLSKTEGTTPGSISHGQTDLSVKPDNVKIKGLQANVSIPKVNLCLLQASVEEGLALGSVKCVTHVSLVALCFDRIATQFRMNRGIVEETPSTAEHGRPSVMLEKYASATKMQPQSSGSLRSNAGIEKGKEIAARLNIHRIHSQLRGLDSTDIGTCAITAIPFEKSKVLFSLEEMEEFSLVDETDAAAMATDLAPSTASLEKWGWIMFECGIENLTVKGGRQSGAILYSAFGAMGHTDATGKMGMSKSNGSMGSQTGSGYSTDVSDNNLPPDTQGPVSDEHSDSDQDEGVESDDLKKDLPLMPPPPDSSSMKLTIREIWFSFSAPTNVRSPSQAISRQLNLLSTATPAIGAWLVPIDQLKSSIRKWDMEGTLRVCAVMGCIMTEALEKKSIHIPIRSKYNRVTKRARYLHENPSSMLCNILHRYLQQTDYSVIEEATMNDGLPALVTLKKGLVALARQWMKFIVVTQGFKAIGLLRPNPLPKPKEPQQDLPDGLQGLDNGVALQSDTSADGAEFEFDAATVSEHTMLLEGACSRPPPKESNSGPVSGVEIMRKLSKSHAHSESVLKIKGSHPYQSLSYTSGDTAADSPAHISRVGMANKDSPRKESLLSNLTGSFRSLHNLLEGTPQRNEPPATVAKSTSLTRTGNSLGTDVLTEHPLLSEPSSVSFYNWMSNAVGNRTGAGCQESPVARSNHNVLQTGGTCNLPTIASASDFNTVLSSDQNTLDGTQSQHSQHSTSQDDIADIEEGTQCPAAVQLADAQVVFKPLLSHTGIQAQDATPLSYKMYFGEHLSFSGTLECLRADIVDSDTSKERKNKRSRRQGRVNLPPLEFKPALLIETFSLNAVVMEKSSSSPQCPTAAPLSFHDLNRRHYNTFHCDFTAACQSISQRVDMALVRLIHQFSTMIDDIKATQTDIKLSRYTAGSTSPTPTFKARPYRHFRSSDFSRSSRGSLNGAARSGNQTLKSKRGVGGGGGVGTAGGAPPNGPASATDTFGRREPRGRSSLGRSERRTSKISRKGSRDVADHMAIQMDDSDSITVSEQSEPSAECWQNMYKLLNFYSLISDPTGILEKSSPENCIADVCRSSEPLCKVVFENEQQESATPNKLLGVGGRRRSLLSSEPQHVTLIVFGIGMVNRTHLEADIGGLTMEAELKKIHGSFTLKDKMKDILHQKMTETCASAHIGGVNIVLLEGITPDIQLEDFPTSPTSTAKQEFLTVVKCNISKSQALYSAQRGLKTNNTAVFKVGAILINIPQHPATLHSMMVRSSHQLSKQISDLIRQPSNSAPAHREDTPTPQSSDKQPSVHQTPVEANEFPQLPEGLEKKPIVLKFSAMLDGITIGAALLPSLKAEYKMGRMKSHGMTGAQTSFTFELPNHKLCFQSKVSPVDMSTMPPSASLNLPPITMSGEYIMEEHDGHTDQGWAPEDFATKQANYLQGNYLRCVAEIGSFEHNLTTDLLNHLVFLQKVFMKEVNEVIQKVSGGEQPIPLWNEHDISTDADKPKILLYSLSLMFKGIQMTATTPSMRAVRFETGLIELELSNRIQCKAQPGGGSSYLKLFGKCQVDLHLALGQIVKHQVYEEAGSDFHQVAYFRTRIGLRNALQEEISGSSDKEAVLITLNRPIVFAQPVAFDRAVLFWLNYKAAYDNWNEQRLALNKDIHVATKEVVDKLPGIQQTSAQAFSTLFLQLTVNDLGICLPITNAAQSAPQANHTVEFDTGSALVLTIESTLITACSSESLVSKGHFKNFCIRFAEGFETSWDDWKPEIRSDLVINACVVPDGTYEVCSRTTGQASAESSSAGTWTLNVLWKMCGIDVHMDPNIGKRLNALGNTLTSLTGEEDTEDIAERTSPMADLSDEDDADTMSPSPHMSPEVPFSPRLTLRKRLVNHILGLSPRPQSVSSPADYLNCATPRLEAGDTKTLRPLSWGCEPVDPRRQLVTGNQVVDARGRKFTKRLVDIRELNEQAKVIDDLKKLGASEGTINQEIQRYQQLESVAVNDIRRDVRKKLRRSSMRAASLKDKWGLGYKPSYNRSKSISAAAGRPPLKKLDRQSSSKAADVEDLPDVRMEASSPGPRVTFNIQDTINKEAMDSTNMPLSPGEVFKFPEETESELLCGGPDEPPHPHHLVHPHHHHHHHHHHHPQTPSSEGHYPVFSAPATPAVFSPALPFQHDGGHHQGELSSSSSEDTDKDEDYERVRPFSYRRPLQMAQKKASGFAAVSQLFSERWPSTPSGRSFLSPPIERNIDFELDVRVEIDSGKCVLHPTPSQPEHEEVSFKRSCDRSLRSLDQESPPKKKKLQPAYSSTSHLLTGKKCPSTLQTKSNDLETTVFYIPGVDVKLHYNSKTLKTESPSVSRGSSLPFSKESKLFGMKDVDSLANAVPSKTNSLTAPLLPSLTSAKAKGSGGVKTAKLYAWVALQTLPEEMVISPCLLDFLEKALETIPITPVERNYTSATSQEEDLGQFEPVDSLEESATSLVSSSTSAYSSFPVDVVVYVRVQPSQIRFSCLPMSRVECMLKLPSLDLVFSSNRGELEVPAVAAHPNDGQHIPPSTPPGQHIPKPPPGKASPLLGSPLGRSRQSSSQSDLSGPPANSSSSGLSFTACMSDFSLYVFHPYGAGKQKPNMTGLPSGPGNLGTVEEEASSVTGRKDSLSINLEFVKVSLSRMRRTGGPTFLESFIPTKGGKMDTTLINISAVCDIGSASFKYDMRRLSEILAFPRAWYRRSIARRLFLGDQTINLPASGPATPDSSENASQHLSPEASRKAYWRTWDGSTGGHASPNLFSDHLVNTSLGGFSHLKSPIPVRTRSVSDSSAPRQDCVTRTSTPSSAKNGKVSGPQGTPWETLVVFAINLKQLNVQMNMSNVMGNNTWTTSGLKSQGRLSVGSNRDREISMSVGLGRSKLDSKGGVVGGNIDVNTLEMVSHISEHPNQQPSHKIQITMGSTEARVDYMGSSILMGVFSNADLQLQDEWKVNLNTVDTSLSEKSEIFIHGDLQWDIFQVIISRSTTPDLIKIGMKLQEFFTQQFDTSKRALSTWGPGSYLPPKAPLINIEKGATELYLDAAHHRHWPGVLKVIAGCHISLFQMPLPEDAVQLGGSMSLHGNHMTLACFHGPNFRSKSWALFHLEEPNIAFWTEAQKIWEDGSNDDSTYIVQTLDFHLGHNTMVTKPCGALESPMATITKITRRRHENPPHGVATVQEWFNYVTAMRNEELNLLRNVDTNNEENGSTTKSSSLLSSFRGSSSYNHETETIFALPRMQLDFKSIHVQEPDEPSLTDSDSKPKVECSVVTEFTDHICVTMDAELIMFLHDLVSAYLKEKEKALFAPRIFTTRPGQKSPTTLNDDSSSDKEEGINYTTVDWREFMCNTWHLEPTLRLISWTGRKIDPVGVDYILQKLGFHHARTTIPKWLQRGVMDPLDKVLSVLIKKLGTALQDEKEKKGRDKEDH
ncbi:bridge-like lipid transfer protein family member 1 isoform X7 [Gadus morhua]|uniref:bridge-like lipid transfer protein family member 1 isoform X7 n=1 Tax=Gadus morhua TaxID=8049 RepID=UPI0011B54FDA|nr:transmembrane protein KIAA1109 homolog isoform X7 [Gadus morhua]